MGRVNQGLAGNALTTCVKHSRDGVSGRHGGLSLRTAVHELAVLTVIVAVATVLKHLGFLYPIERFLIDLFAVTEPTAPATRTALIDIDEESYHGQYFNATSPIHPALIAKLIEAAALGGSKVVVVDIDTDAVAVMRELKELKGAQVASTVPIVWAVAGRQCQDTLCIVPSRPLAPDGATDLQRSGLAMLLHDGDGVLRRYLAEFETARVLADNHCECTGSMAPTLPRAAALAYDPGLPSRQHKPLVLNWRGDRLYSPRFPAFRVLDARDKEWWPAAADPLRGKVTLIGGTFGAGRDSRRTPAGEMAGVEVLAHIVETELSGGGMVPYSFSTGVLLEFIVGLALTIVNTSLGSVTRRRLLANTVLVVSVPLVASWLLYRFSLYWVSLAPVIAGVTLHQWHERAKGLRVHPVHTPIKSA